MIFHIRFLWFVFHIVFTFDADTEVFVERPFAVLALYAFSLGWTFNHESRHTENRADFGFAVDFTVDVHVAELSFTFVPFTVIANDSRLSSETGIGRNQSEN